MRDYEEKSYYEIQLDNKQLILVFLAGVTVCVLVFVLGVMVGKGRKEAEIAAAGRNEQKIVTPEPDLTPPQEIETANPPAKKQKNEKKDENSAEASTQDDPAYYDLNKTEERPLEKEPQKEPKEETKIASKEPEKKKESEPPKTESQKAETSKTQAQKVEAEKAEALKAEAQKAEAETEGEPEAEPGSAAKQGGRYTVQVMATSSKPKAEQQLASLQSKGYTAFMDEQKAGEISVFKVRVGQFTDRDAARKIATKIKQELQLETWVANLD